MANLPEELMIEILSRLPPESLLRFKSVRKSWYALINNDPKFATKHLLNSPQHKHILLNRFLDKKLGHRLIFSILKLPIALDLDVDLPLCQDSMYLDFHSHSNGLLCLGDGRRDIFLCNVTTREFRKLPPSILLEPPPSELNCYHLYTNAVGFGYDEKSKDFKVVRVVNFRDVVNKYRHVLHKRVEIYDLSKDKWREIETTVCCNVFSPPLFQMYLKGTYYWWAHKAGVNLIQSFDMSEEVFGKIPVPDSFKEPCDRYRSMGVLNGSMVMFYYPCKGNEKPIDVWGMEKDECGVVSWSILLTIDHVSGIEKPLLFVNSNELLMESTKQQMILYNIKTQQIKEVLPMKGHPLGSGSGASFFIKTLFSVKGVSNITNCG